LKIGQHLPKLWSTIDGVFEAVY